MNTEAINRLKDLLDWSDRIGSDEIYEIKEIINLLNGYKRIEINNDAAKLRKEELLDRVIKQANIAADEGKTSFYFHFKEDDKNNLPPPMFDISLREKTSGQIEPAYKGVGKYKTNYIIKIL